MPYSAGDLTKELREVISVNLAKGRPVYRASIVGHVLSRHPLAEDVEDRDFNVLCRYAAVVEAARAVLQKLKVSANDPEQVSGQGELPLAGYKHLQKGYPVERDGELMFVPLPAMSSKERRARAEQYNTMAKGCSEHAAELIRYDENMSPQIDAA